MDFSQLLAQQAQPLPIEPTAVYASRADKAKGYGYLRDVQSDVLKAWHDRRTASDLVIKVNTGAGKTIDGLVILQSYLNAGEGPALYVAPDRRREVGVAQGRGCRPCRSASAPGLSGRDRYLPFYKGIG